MSRGGWRVVLGMAAAPWLGPGGLAAQQMAPAPWEFDPPPHGVAEGIPEPGKEQAGKKEPAEVPPERKEIDNVFAEAVDSAALFTWQAGQGTAITLAEALWLTLALQPGVKLADEEVRRAEAFFRQAQGVFDWNLFADLQKNRPVTPLSEREVQAQLLERRRLSAASLSMARVADAIRNGDRDVSVIVPDAQGNLATRRVPIDSLFIESATGVDGRPSLVLREGAGAVNDVGLANALEQINDNLNDPDLAALRQSLLDRQEAAFLGGAATAAELSGVPVQRVLRTESLTYNVGVQKLFRNGLVLSPSLAFEQQGDDNLGTAAMDFLIPLLKDRGARIERAQEESARIDFLASGQQLVHRYSEVLQQTAVAFWNVLARQQELQLLLVSEDINQTFVELTRLREKGGEASAAETAQALTSLMSVRANRLSVEFALFEARQDLALAIGFDGKKLIAAPFASGTLPLAPGAKPAPEDIVQVAVNQRRDLMALRSLERSGKILADAALRNIGPRLDFQSQLTMTGRSQGTGFEEYFTAYGDDTAGLGLYGSLRFQWPIQDRLAKGQYLAAEAEYRRRQVTASELERTIKSRALVAAEGISVTSRQVGTLQEAASAAKQALVAERTLYTQGEATLLDTIQIQEQYVGLLRNLIAARFQHGVAITRLRYQTGTLIEGGSGELGDYRSVRAIVVNSPPDVQHWKCEPVEVPAPEPKTWREQLESICASRREFSEPEPVPAPLLRPVRGGPLFRRQLREAPPPAKRWTLQEALRQMPKDPPPGQTMTVRKLIGAGQGADKR